MVKTTRNYYLSFVSLCSSVIYAMEQPGLKFFCHDTAMHVECQRSFSGDEIMMFAEDVDGNVTTPDNNNSTGRRPLSVMVLEYNSSDGSYKTALCECETEHCDAENKSLASKSKRFLRPAPTSAPVTPGVREKDGKQHFCEFVFDCIFPIWRQFEEIVTLSFASAFSHYLRIKGL
jgi:hypothetical protein